MVLISFHCELLILRTMLKASGRHISKVRKPQQTFFFFGLSTLENRKKKKYINFFASVRKRWFYFSLQGHVVYRFPNCSMGLKIEDLNS